MIIPVSNTVYFDYNVMAFKVTGFSKKFANSTLASNFIASISDN